MMNINIVEDFKRMTEGFKTDYQNRIGTLQQLFRDTHRALNPVLPNLHTFRRDFGHQMTKMMEGIRDNHKKMAESVRGICNNAKKMMHSYHDESNKRAQGAAQMYGAARTFLRTMAAARRMHPLQGMGTMEPDAPSKPHPKHTKKGKHANNRKAA